MLKHTCSTQPKISWLDGSHMHFEKRKRENEKKIPKNFLYGKLAQGTRNTGCPFLYFKDVCKRDTKSAAIDIESWELMVKDRSTWQHLVKEGIKHTENT